MKSNRPLRAIYVLNHKTAMPFEVEVLRALGFEVFVPKVLPDDTILYRSATASSDWDESLSLPESELERLNSVNFYDRALAEDVKEIIERQFDLAFLIAAPNVFAEFLTFFSGVIMVRIYGQDNAFRYTDQFRRYFGEYFDLALDKAAKRFFFAQIFDQIADVECERFRAASLTLPLGLPDSYFASPKRWRGGAQDALFIAPDLMDVPYYRNIYDRFLVDFEGFSYKVLGTQRTRVDDPNVCGFLPDAAFHELMATAAAFVYPSLECRHLHYTPVEAMLMDMPVLFDARGALSRFFPSKAPGAYASVEEGRSKLLRLTRRDQSMIDEICGSQWRVTDKMTLAWSITQWRERFDAQVFPLLEARSGAKAVTNDKSIPRIAICALFRNSADYVGYFRAVTCNQIGDGRDFDLIFSLVEGDSSDSTLEMLQDWASSDPRVVLTRHDIEPIADFDDRVRKWADLGNTAIAALGGRRFDYLLWCESDLCIPADLIRMLLEANSDVVAPAIFLGGMFYDTWGFRGTDGSKFSSLPSVHPSFQNFGLFPVNSVGSVVMFRRAVIDSGIRFRGTYENGLLVGMCNDAREKGFGVYCDSRVSVIHPTSLWRRGMYLLGAVEVAGAAAPESLRESVRKLIWKLIGQSSQGLGQPAIPPNDPIFQPLATYLAQELPDWSPSISTRLHSEAPKQYCLLCELVPRRKVSPERIDRRPNSPDRDAIMIDGVFFQMFQTGIARVWRSLLREWAATDFGKRLRIVDRDRTAPRFDGLAYIDAPRHDYADLDTDRALLQRICDDQGAAVFISTYYSAPTSTPTVFMAHDMIPEILGVASDDNPMWREKHASIRQACRHVAVSANTARDLHRFFPAIPIERISVAHCGVDFSPPEGRAVTRFLEARGIDRPYFLLVGARDGYKNAGLFFQAFAALGDERSKYAIVCTGPVTELETEFRPHLGEATLHMLQLDDHALQCAYAGALTLVFPSFYEGFGMPVVEAMACGCPVITTRRGSIPEVAGDAVLYVDAVDVREMSRALRAVQKASTRQRLIRLGRQRARAFSWETMARQVRAVLEQAIAETAASERSAACLATAMRHHQSGNFAEAEAIYRQILAADNLNFAATHMLGVVRLQRGDLAEAESLLQRAVGMNEFLPEAQFNLGMTCLAQGRRAEARARIRRALELNADFALAREQLNKLDADA